ncbi:hypothetical protein LEP1GSC193_3554 [Leptospira alstonii serovar Pingchang str. 80-412]|uniref:Uncharacterized protein n=2 Tax=Leptospira alstonii TaxID=28452 RepID=M6CUW5_9LEPT|nr:hypothetical protein LEP1GSC194_3742 [Leptospira alstonii serovar Sichuan str. 79601]EQA81262.1 hypothetical protein LEP1GSC193_3554 [Leptospira alstonii serovar Pingchang str. 80-412]
MISQVTDFVMETVMEWQNRSLDNDIMIASYPRLVVTPEKSATYV